MKKEKKKKQTQSSVEPLTDEEINMLKSAMASRAVDRSTLPSTDNSDAAKIRRFIKKNKTFTAACVILCVFIVALLVILGVMAVRNALANRVNTDDFTVMIGDEVFTVKYETAMHGDVIYVDMYKIASYAELTKTGRTDNVKFTASPTQYLRFENDSEFAVINGALVEMDGKAVVNRDVCEIPLSFLSAVLGKDNGLRITLDTSTNTIKVVRRMYKSNNKEAIDPVEIIFHSDSFNIIQSIKRPDEAASDFEYSIDISAYINSIAPENDGEYLILANKQTPLGEDYKPTDLKKLECRTNKEMYLREDAARALYAMMLAMNADGITDVFVTSAYRSYSYQVGLFDKYVNGHMAEGMSREEAEAAASEYSARAGTSEHQTGLCLDFMTEDMSGLDESFEDTVAFAWLSENAHKYGFILRYAEDKVDVTGYKYEPWHYRFVGRTAATEIHQSNLCLEEYLALN